MNFAVIGHPIEHSLSPLMHQANFNAQGLDDSYIALNIPPAHFVHLKDIAAEKELDGFNVTLPHKTAVMNFLDEIDDEAMMMGAVNTVKIEGGRWKGYNTDGRGFMESLYHHFHLATVENQNILILGAGGASRALAYQLIKAGAFVTIANRTVERVQDWPFQVKAVRLEEVSGLLSQTDIFINTTPIGMEGYAVQQLSDLAELNSRTLVADIIYNPKETPLLLDAKKAGCQVMNGLDMFINQGAISYEIWTGRPADRSVMKEAVVKALEQ